MSSHGSPLVYVNVLNWNGFEDTERCLESLKHLEYENHRVLVVDNGSTDGSAERLREHHSDLEILRIETNAGVAHGNNAGIRHAMDAGAAYIWLLDNDTAVEPGALQALIDAAEADPRRGALVSRELGMATKEDWNAAFEIEAGERRPVRCRGCSNNGSWHRADMIRGASFMVRCDTLAEVGLFDEAYFHYFDEEDLAERIRRARWELGLVCNASVLHKGGSTLAYETPQSTYYLVRNRLLYRRKLDGEHPLLVIAKNPSILRRAISFRGLLARDLRPTVAGLFALLDAIRDRWGPRELGPEFREPFH